MIKKKTNYLRKIHTIKNNVTNVNETDVCSPKKICKINLSKKLGTNFFNTASYILAQQMLGKVLVRKLDEVIYKGRIVETECYPGGDDKASCTFNGKRTVTTEPLYMEPGTAFVYMTYGIYHCINISASEPGGGVLIRALEPMEGINYIRKWRIAKTKTKKEISTENLCNGPSKLCTGLQITKEDCNMLNFITSDSMWIEEELNFTTAKIVQTTRIGINSAGKEWAEKPYRFYILGNNFVSKKDLLKESEIYNQN